MIFVAGVPKGLVQGLAGKLAKRLPNGSKLVDVRPAENHGRFEVGNATKYIEFIASRVEKSPKEFTDGLSVIVVHAPNEDIRAFVESFFPFALVANVELDWLFSYGSNKISETQRNLVASLEPLLKSQLDIRRQVRNYLQNRLPRTPFALPNKAFGDQLLGSCIHSLCLGLPLAVKAGAVENLFLAEEKVFESSFPYSKSIPPSAYENSKGVRFKSPGRHLHGAAWRISNGHQPSCFLNAKFRFGGPIKDGFHYDCSKGANGKLVHNFDDCHYGGIKLWEGKPHLNIFPNDFIRPVA